MSIPEANAEMTFYQQLVNHDRVLDGIIGGSELLEWTITGTDAADVPFSLTSSDRFASDSDIAFSSPWEVADIVWVLSALEGVTVDTVTVDSAVDDDSSTWEVVAVQQRRSGTWVNVSRRLPALARAGRTLTLRAVLEGPAGTRTVPLQFAIPARAAGSMGGIEVVGGTWAESFPGDVNSVDEMATYVARLTRNDAVEARMFLELGRRGYTRRVVSNPTEKVVVGAATAHRPGALMRGGSGRLRVMSDQTPAGQAPTAATTDDLRSVALTRVAKGRYRATNKHGTVLPIGSGRDEDFTPVELLLTAIAACSATDVDLITTKRTEPDTFDLRSEGRKVRDEQGNHLVDLRVTFEVRYPEGEDGDRAREMLPRAITQTCDRLCTVGRTVALGETIDYVEA